MATTSQPSPFTPTKQPEVKRPQEIFGGGFEDFESGKRTVNQAYNSPDNLKIEFSDWLFHESKTVKTSFPTRGSITFNQATEVSQVETKSQPENSSITYSVAETATKAATATAEKTTKFVLEGIKEAVSVTSLLGNVIGVDLFWKEIAGQGKKAEKPKSSEDQKKEAEIQFKKNRSQALDDDLKRVKMNRKGFLAKIAQSISEGKLSLGEVAAAKNINVSAQWLGEELSQNIGESDVHFFWRQREDQKRKAEEAEKNQNIAETITKGKGGKLGEGDLLKKEGNNVLGGVGDAAA